jgi:hypothetical protein
MVDGVAMASLPTSKPRSFAEALLGRILGIEEDWVYLLPHTELSPSIERPSSPKTSLLRVLLCSLYAPLNSSCTNLWKASSQVVYCGEPRTFVTARNWVYNVTPLLWHDLFLCQQARLLAQVLLILILEVNWNHF